MIEKAKKRLQSFGYEWKNGDEAILAFSVQKVKDTIKNNCNISSVPKGLTHIAVDMVVGEFLSAKKAFAPDDLSELNLEAAVKQIQEGDVSVTFSIGEGTKTAEQRLDSFINYLLTYGRDEFIAYRRLRW